MASNAWSTPAAFLSRPSLGIRSQMLRVYRLRDLPRAAGSMRRHHTVQLSRHGAALDVSVGDSLRSNTFILKPSEKVPLTAVLLVELLAEAGLPPGVLNLVHGGRATVDGIPSDPRIQAVSFVGSTPVAQYIYETGTRAGKRVQANGGAKNFLIIMPDADVSRTVDALSASAFGCAGERCMAGSTAVVVGAAAAERLLPPLTDAARSIRVDQPIRARNRIWGR